MEAEDELTLEEITGDENEKTGLGIHAKANRFEIFLTNSKENVVFQERNFLMSCYRFLVLQMPSRTSLLARRDCMVTKCPFSLAWGVKGLNHT